MYLISSQNIAIKALQVKIQIIALWWLETATVYKTGVMSTANCRRDACFVDWPFQATV